MKKYLSLIILSSLFVGFVAYATVKTKQVAIAQDKNTLAIDNQIQDTTTSETITKVSNPKNDSILNKNSISDSNISSDKNNTPDVTNLTPFPIVETPQKVIAPEKKTSNDDSYNKISREKEHENNDD